MTEKTIKKSFILGALFFAASFLVGSTNDLISKLLGYRLPSIEIVFFRFFFGFVSLLPFVFTRGASILKTNYLKLNILRGFLGFVAITLCVYGVTILPLAEFTPIFWSIPLVVLVMSSIFLKEKVSAPRWIATIVGFVGIITITCLSCVSMRLAMLVPLSAVTLFASQDVIIKRMVVSEDRITMLLYFSMVTTALGIIPTIYIWQTPTLRELILLFILGIGGNLLQFFIFKAFEKADLSAIAPIRYIDFIFASIFGYIFFGALPNTSTYIGVSIIIPSTLFLVYYETKKKQKS